jgi:hypothetical protein
MPTYHILYILLVFNMLWDPSCNGLAAIQLQFATLLINYETQYK